jgi:hypothetical protein
MVAEIAFGPMAVAVGVRSATGSQCFFNVMMTDSTATESTEKHGKNQHPLQLFPCHSVDSVAKKNAGTQLDLSASVIIKFKAY